MGDPTLVPQLIADLKRDDGALTLRILFSSTSGAGHLGPLVPYAQALARRGHEVRVSSPEGASAALQRAGLAHARVADPSDEEAKAFWVRMDAAKGDDAQALAWREGFSGSPWKFLFITGSGQISSVFVSKKEGLFGEGASKGGNVTDVISN